MSFLLERWKWTLYVINAYLIQDLYFVYVVEAFITLHCKASYKYICLFSSIPLVRTHLIFLYKLLVNRRFNFRATHAHHVSFDEEFTPQGVHVDFFIHDDFFRPLGLHLLVWSELERSWPFRPMRDLRMQWLWAFRAISHMRLRAHTASNGSCLMVTWTIFKNQFLEVGLTQNQETMALRTLTTVDLFYLITCEDLHE